ncbi:CMRF35-like molecule 5 [Sardina pilchardus]|uniref:CMRF35-like molecule 5 n=1 Tax=Sardina pilchardus TaxID=27697 RepID=UPI002E160DF0
MKNMLIFYVTCALLVGAHIVSSVYTVEGHIGGNAVIECPYPSDCEQRQKYVCRGDCRKKDILVQTADGQVWTETGRFSLRDNTTARVFTVTITGLTAKDSGKYWCAVQFPWYRSDLYTELRIDVGPAPVTTLSPVIITEVSTVSTPLQTFSTDLVTTGKNISSVPPLVRRSPTTNITGVVCGVAAVVIVVLLSMLGVLLYFKKADKRTETTDVVFLNTNGCSSSNIYSETGVFAEELSHGGPPVIQQHQNPITTSSSTTTTTSPSSSTLSSAPPQSEQIYELPESLYQRMAPVARVAATVPRDNSLSARTADGAEYMTMKDCRVYDDEGLQSI